MSPKAKNKSFPPVKVTEDMLEETKKQAEIADEYLSDYIRKAVDNRNKFEAINIAIEVDSTHKNNTVSRTKDNRIITDKDCKTCGHSDGNHNCDVPIEKCRCDDEIEYFNWIPKGTIKPKSTMVQTYGKGGGKK